MKRKIKLPVLLITLVVVTASSCDKDDQKNNNTIKTNTELLTAGSWKYTGATIIPAYDYYGDGSLVTNIFEIMKDCEKDDIEIYHANGTWDYAEGPTMCDPSDPQIFNEPWHFADNETKLFVGSVEHTILELTATRLKLTYTFEDGGVIYTEEDTYAH
jgi:hypothetical protein